MRAVIDLLKQKNNYLIQFKKISSLECHRFQTGDYHHIEQFYYSRQIILDAIESIDANLKKIKKTQEISQEDKNTILALLQERQKITLDIVKQDILIHSYLNDLQHNMVEDHIA